VSVKFGHRTLRYFENRRYEIAESFSVFIGDKRRFVGMLGISGVRFWIQLFAGGRIIAVVEVVDSTVVQKCFSRLNAGQPRVSIV